MRKSFHKALARFAIVWTTAMSTPPAGPQITQIIRHVRRAKLFSLNSPLMKLYLAQIPIPSWWVASSNYNLVRIIYGLASSRRAHKSSAPRGHCTLWRVKYANFKFVPTWSRSRGVSKLCHILVGLVLCAAPLAEREREFSRGGCD